MLILIKLIFLFSISRVSLANYLANCPAENQPTPNTTAILRCGGVLTDDEGKIEYKPASQQVVANERCVWIIAAPQAWAYDVKVTHLDYGINRDSSRFSQALLIVDENFKSYFPTCQTSDNFWFRVLIVIFATGENAGVSTGFTMKYKTTTKDETYPLCSHYVFYSPLSLFKYPVDRRYYDNRELSIFVFLPTNNIYAERIKKRVGYKRFGLATENGCGDYVTMRKFSYNSWPNWWGNETRICGDTDGIDITHNDIVIAVFHSDFSTQSTGFWLQHI